MTSKPKAPRFRLRRNPSRPVTPVSPASASADDGFGSAAFPGSAKAEADKATMADLSDIRKEGLTGRQLRMARRLAQKHGLEPSSDFEAVRLLRAKGIDPFDKAAMLELVVPEAKPQTPAKRPAPAPVPAGDGAPAPQLPKTVPQPDDRSRLPGHPVAPDPGAALHDLERIQQDIVRRRRRKLRGLAGRLILFVALPTALVTYYYAAVATPSYTTASEFVIEQADTPAGSGGLLSGTSFASSQDSIVVQDFLQSREAMLRLSEEEGYRAHVSDPAIDWWQRLPADASNEDAYDSYRADVKLGYDPTEGVIRMEVTAFDPATSQRFSEALIGYAEERIDGVSERKRTDQMRGARENYEDGETRMQAAQDRVVALQEDLGVVDAASENAAIMSQINGYEVQLNDRRLQLQTLLDNRRPNQARVTAAEGDITRLEGLIGELRGQLTESTGDRAGLATVSAELRMAETELQTRTMMLQEAMQQMVTAQREAERQVRYLQVGISPVPPDVPTAPKVLNNAVIAFLVCAGLYLIASLTVAILREQVST